ncbi:AraC family transcriptional regulator [Neolewinella aurantiaca]|uniref:AraC family transcriptional regulator n=1 Tax=Neolewinella aurantiaca TaxID=2602767 RepID=A0A5C7FXT7_9BACT|nr:helix-turn-helix transcriptional regulator [Neolewinella aurantiaca]TXF89808.1 AraC family transcriptional regulator [Neolewinella aurantiaca]
MEEEIPKILFNTSQSLQIEVMTFEQLFRKISQSKDHNPFAPHKIEFYLVLVVTEGSYTHFVDFNDYALAPGSAIFIAKNQVHHFTEKLTEAEGYGIIFSSTFMEEYYLLSGNRKFNRLFNYHIESPVIRTNEPEENVFSEIADHLYREFKFPNSFAKAEMLRTLLHVLLLKAERTKEMYSGRGAKKQWLEIFNSFKDLLETDYEFTRNSRAYASKLLISYKFLNDVVKQLTGKTVKAFIDDFVTMEIKRYLVSTSLSVKEISYRTGFEDSANMVKFFKRNAQTTPLKFRRAV